MAAEQSNCARFCQQCGYNLHGLPEHRCPECGRRFDPHNRKTFSRRPGAPSRRRWVWRISVSLLALVLLAGAGALNLWYPWHREQPALRLLRHNPRCCVWVKTVGPRWLQRMLGWHAGFLLVRADEVDIGSFAPDPIRDVDLAPLEGLSELTSLDLHGNVQITDAGLEHLKDLKQLQSLALSGTQVTDAGLVYLQHMKALSTLDLNDTKVTDAGLERLQDLTGLQGLFLADTRVTDAGLAHLTNLTRLRTLNLTCTQVTGAGFEHLKNLNALQVLILDKSPVTDSGLQHLKALNGLQQLNVVDTGVTYFGVARLKKALPDCMIWRSRFLLPGIQGS